MSKNAIFDFNRDSDFALFNERNTYYYTMNHYDEHPLEIALAWLVCGMMFSVYFLVKLGAADALSNDNHVSESLELIRNQEHSFYDHSKE